MFENPMEMYNPYYVTSNNNSQRNNKKGQKYTCDCHLVDSDMDDNDDKYSKMYEKYMMDMKKEEKCYNDYYKMNNDNSYNNNGVMSEDMYTDKNNSKKKEDKMENLNKSKDNMLICNCITPLPENPQVAMAYVPFQTKSKMFNCETALQKGTLFEDLYKPFKGRSVHKYE